MSRCFKNFEEQHNITAKYVKFAFLVGLPPVPNGHTFKKPAVSYDILHDHYSITWPSVRLESWPHAYIRVMLCA
jgi:hypothetical protein